MVRAPRTRRAPHHRRPCRVDDTRRCTVRSADDRLCRPRRDVLRRVLPARPGDRDRCRRPPVRRSLARRELGRPRRAARLRRPLDRPPRRAGHPDTRRARRQGSPPPHARGDAVRRHRAARRALGPARSGSTSWAPASSRCCPASSRRSATRLASVAGRLEGVPAVIAAARDELVGAGDRPVSKFHTEIAIRQLAGDRRPGRRGGRRRRGGARTTPATQALLPRLRDGRGHGEGGDDRVRDPPPRRRPADAPRARGGSGRSSSPPSCATRCGSI